MRLDDGVKEGIGLDVVVVGGDAQGRVAKVEGLPNNGFKSWSTGLPVEIYRMILQFVMSGESGQRDASAFAQVCKSFNAAYRPYLVPFVMPKMQRKLFQMQRHPREKPGDTSVVSFSHMCLFIATFPVEGLQINVRLNIFEKIRKALSYKSPLNVNSNDISSLIREAFSWPLENQPLPPFQHETVLRLYRAFFAAIPVGVLPYESVPQHSNVMLLMPGRNIDSATAQALAASLNANLIHFISAINSLIDYEVGFGLISSRSPYKTAFAILDFFRDNLKIMGISSANTKYRLNNGEGIQKYLKRWGLEDCLSHVAYFGMPMGTFIGGFFGGLSFVPILKHPDFGPVMRTISFPFLAIFALSLLFYFLRTASRNISLERLSDNASGIWNRPRENMDETRPLLAKDRNQGASVSINNNNNV